MIKHFSVIITLTCLLEVMIAAPTITVWYGNNQSFGQRGNPQTAVNILGNVSDPSGIQSLSYALNGGSSINLSRGPDTRRLLRSGDFNIDIFTSNLNNGSNTIVITAINSSNETSTANVVVQYTPGNTWALPYSVDWSSAGSIQSVAQVVDGDWTLNNGKVRPRYLGYDRLVAIGDKTWTDYEVTVPITLYSLDTSGFNGVSQTPGVGLLFRWTGHTDDPVSGQQPKTGFLPLGAIGWYSWDYGNTGGVRLKLVGNNLNTMQEDNSGFRLMWGVTYIFKMRVETIPGLGAAYKFKVWQAGQSEPSAWTLQGQQSLSDPQNGCVCLLSHHVDAEFGNVTITPITATPVQLSSFTAQVMSNNLVRLDWTTASETNNYGFEVQKSFNTTNNFSTIPRSFVAGNGTTTEPQYYSWIDSAATAGNWYYRLKQMDLDGTTVYTEPARVSVLTGVRGGEVPGDFALQQNYPNPFNPTTKMSFVIGHSSLASLKVFDVLGREVETLVNEVKAPGMHDVTFNAERLPSGVYVYRLTAGGKSASRRMLLMK